MISKTHVSGQKPRRRQLKRATIGLLSHAATVVPPGSTFLHWLIDTTKVGCGVLTSDGQWFQVQWPISRASVHIAAKELVPVVIAVAVWGKQWPGQTVLVCSDNMAVVAQH